ncbi:hypothetical protein [Sphingomonas sp.]|uniref:hypothetical protein n=1 Tax=Sphingomonas sp. TaxID=28214 RepID=UPI0035C79A21
MTPTEPLPLHHSWPMYESGLRFDLGQVHDIDGRKMFPDPAALPSFDSAPDDGGLWHCDLATQALSWSPGVRRLFGMAPDALILRERALESYDILSAATMERLRVYAIRHRRGFTLDVRLRNVAPTPRWMRLIAAPHCEAGRVVALYGVKRDVTALYHR